MPRRLSVFGSSGAAATSGSLWIRSGNCWNCPRTWRVPAPMWTRSPRRIWQMSSARLPTCMRWLRNCAGSRRPATAAARFRTAASLTRSRRTEPWSPWTTYIAAALAEIAGCFAFWAWYRLGHSPLWLLPGMALLAAFAWLLALSPVDQAGRAYAVIWRRLHRLVTSLALDCRRPTPRSVGRHRGRGLPCRSGHHPLDAQRGVSRTQTACGARRTGWRRWRRGRRWRTERKAWSIGRHAERGCHGETCAVVPEATVAPCRSARASRGMAGSPCHAACRPSDERYRMTARSALRLSASGGTSVKAGSDANRRSRPWRGIKARSAAAPSTGRPRAWRFVEVSASIECFAGTQG